MNNELNNFLDKHIEKSIDSNRIDVFPIPCGVGKSTYIPYAISNALLSGEGLIIITDSVDRLNEYVLDDISIVNIYRFQKQLNRFSTQTKKIDKDWSNYYKRVRTI